MDFASSGWSRDIGLQTGGSRLQGIGIDCQCNIIVAVEQQRGNATRPDLLTGFPVAQASTEYTVHKDDRGFHCAGFEGGIAR